MDTSWFQTIEIPQLIMYNEELLRAMIVSIRYSMRSIGTIGLLGLGVILSASFLVKFVNEHFMHGVRLREGVRKKIFSREVNQEDWKRNPNTIIEDGLLKRTIQHHITSRWNKRHRAELVDDAVFRKQVNLAADIRFMNESQDDIKIQRMIKEDLGRSSRDAYRDVASRYYNKKKGNHRLKRGGLAVADPNDD